MDKIEVERAATTLHQEIWAQRALIWPEGHPHPVAMLDPRVVITKVLGYEYEVRDKIGGDGSRQRGASAGGFFDRGRGIVAISASFSEEVQRYTAAHEIGHALLHPWVGDKVIHRDVPLGSADNGSRLKHEKEADYFAACFLMPRRLMKRAFTARFGSEVPLHRNETVDFYLSGSENTGFFSASADSLKFSSMLARAESFGQRRFESMAMAFRVSVRAMAIRIQELGFVSSY